MTVRRCFLLFLLLYIRVIEDTVKQFRFVWTLSPASLGAREQSWHPLVSSTGQLTFDPLIAKALFAGVITKVWFVVLVDPSVSAFHVNIRGFMNEDCADCWELPILFCKNEWKAGNMFVFVLSWYKIKNMSFRFLSLCLKCVKNLEKL